MFVSVTLFDMLQFLVNNLQRIRACAIPQTGPKANDQRVTQKGRCRFAGLAKIVHGLRWNNHFGFK